MKMAAENVSAALRQAANRLADVSDTARLDAEILMAHALGVSRSDMLLRHMQAGVPAQFAGIIERRARHEPVAYICGEQEFFGRRFSITPDVLIPRSDSECVVEAALEVLPDEAPGGVRVLDCGTGSGALLLTLLAKREGAEGIGVENSPAAAAIARLNAKDLGLEARARILERDWCEPGWADDLGSFDCIISNPPYVEAGANLPRDVADYEPASALFAGPQGLDDYHKLIPQLPALLRPGGAIVLEIGASQAEAVCAIGGAAGFVTEVRRDLAGRMRAIICR